MSVSLRAINVLLVDDELAQMELTREALIDADSMLEITTVELPSNAFILFKERDFDCVVSDYQMPEMNGIQFCKKIRETSEVPFIIYTGKGSDEVASAAFGAGASDYVRKEKELAHYKVLAKRIRLAAEKYRSDKALRDREEQIIGIFESITDGFVSLDGGWRYIYVNRAAEKSLKTEKEELVGNVLWNYWPDPPEEFKNALTEAAITKTPKMAEFYYPFLNSWFQINVYPSDTGVNVYFQDVSERKRAEEELRSASIIVQEERDRLKSLVDSMQDEVWFADTSGKFTLANPSAVTEFKLDGLEVGVEELARSLEVCRPDGSLRPAEESPPLRALRGEVVHNQEEVVRTPATGEIRWRQVSSSPVRSNDGCIIGSVSVVRDITESKKAKDDLKTMVDELTASNMELAAMDEELRASIEELAAIEEELRTSNEELMLQTMRLRESEERFRALSQTSPVGVGVSSADGVLVYTNPAYESILGYGSGELLGKKALDLYMYPEERIIWLDKMKGGDFVRDYELRLKRKEGTPVWVSINTSDIQYGGKLAVMGTIQDISARKKAEDALRAANDMLNASNEELATKEEELRASNEELRQQALRLRESEEALRGYSANLESMVKEQASRLLRSEHFNVVSSIGATIAHDLRNPLSRINQSIELARRNPDGAERMLEIAKESAQHALNMVEEFRQATTRIELKKLDVNLQTLVWESLGSVKIPEKVDLKVDVSSELGLVNVDPDLLQRVLVNLCVNAVEAMPEGGKLSVLANRDDDMVTIMVADTGVGMSPEVVERLWEPLFTTKSKGLGLGLYFVRNAVEAHGGSVELTTESGKGTTFTLKIPSG